MYALIEFSGQQFRVEEGCTIKVPYIDSKVGSKVPIDNIIYLSDGNNQTIGKPNISICKISGTISEHGRSRKVVVFKFKRRKGYQRKNTHRQKFTLLKIEKFSSISKEVSPDKTAVKKASPDKTAVKKASPKKAAVKKASPKKAAVKKVKE